MCVVFIKLYVLTSDFYENNQRIIGFFMRHIFQELKNRIMGEKKHNLSGPTQHWTMIEFTCIAVAQLDAYYRPYII